MTLGELQARLPSTRYRKAPGAARLRADAEAICSAQLAKPVPASVTVYGNGFALYAAGRHTAVLRVDACASYTWHFTDGTTAALSADEVRALDWQVALTLRGEDRLEHNACMRASALFTEPEEYEWENFLPYDPFAGRFRDRSQEEFLQRFLRALKKDARRLLVLYYACGLPVTEIGRRVGHTPGAVARKLKRLTVRAREQAMAEGLRVPVDGLPRLSHSPRKAANPKNNEE